MADKRKAEWVKHLRDLEGHAEITVREVFDFLKAKGVGPTSRVALGQTFSRWTGKGLLPEPVRGGKEHRWPMASVRNLANSLDDFDTGIKMWLQATQPAKTKVVDLLRAGRLGEAREELRDFRDWVLTGLGYINMAIEEKRIEDAVNAGVQEVFNEEDL